MSKKGSPKISKVLISSTDSKILTEDKVGSNLLFIELLKFSIYE